MTVPLEQDVWLAGTKARINGVPKAANPYAVTTGGEVCPQNQAFALSWEHGWDDASTIADEIADKRLDPLPSREAMGQG